MNSSKISKFWLNLKFVPLILKILKKSSSLENRPKNILTIKIYQSHHSDAAFHHHYSSTSEPWHPPKKLTPPPLKDLLIWTSASPTLLGEASMSWASILRGRCLSHSLHRQRSLRVHSPERLADSHCVVRDSPLQVWIKWTMSSPIRLLCSHYDLPRATVTRARLALSTLEPILLCCFIAF